MRHSKYGVGGDQWPSLDYPHLMGQKTVKDFRKAAMEDFHTSGEVDED